MATLFAACVLLAGCAQSNSEFSAAPQPAAAPVAAAPAPAGPVTSEKAKADCWMKYEGDKRVKDIDARLKLVEKCVDDTMRSQPPAR
jgi:hypothetical protein